MKRILVLFAAEPERSLVDLAGQSDKRKINRRDLGFAYGGGIMLTLRNKAICKTSGFQHLDETWILIYCLEQIFSAIVFFLA